MEEVEIKNLTGMFLIATPALKDPNFERTVVLICDHTTQGSFGIVVNRILLNSFTPLIDSLDVKEIRKDIPVFYGGPVKPEQGYILFIPEDVNYASINIKENLFLTTSKEILIDLALGKGPKKFLFALGFSGWAPGQLEYELMIDSWLIAPADKRIIFDIPVNERWKAAADSIGIDLTRLVDRQGSV
ncbi:MAG: YqgE/AlgH family protein [Thermodesulfovibrionales bacterium]